MSRLGLISQAKKNVSDCSLSTLQVKKLRLSRLTDPKHRDVEVIFVAINDDLRGLSETMAPLDFSYLNYSTERVCAKLYEIKSLSGVSSQASS